MRRKDEPIDKREKKIVRFKKKCIFCKEDIIIEYKNLDVLRHFVNTKGRITSRRINGNCAKHQRKIAKAVKRARFLALLPCVAR